MSIESGTSQETPESEEIEQLEIVHCPECGCEMHYGFEYDVISDVLYVASGGYDGVNLLEWFECPGCGYID